MNKTIDEITHQILPILKKYGAIRAGLFGSCVRGELRERGDVDILVELPEKVGLVEFIQIKLKLEDRLGKKVDLVEYDMIKPRIKEQILREEFRIL